MFFVKAEKVARSYQYHYKIPFPQSYWVVPGLLCAGHYPGAENDAERDRKLAGLLDCGIQQVISLIPEGETGAGGRPFKPYLPRLEALAAQRSLRVAGVRLGFPDGTAPTPAHMVEILDTIDAAHAAGCPVYVHCWGGHGRTSTVIGCYLVRHGHTPEDAIQQILAWREPLPHNWPPFESGQAAFVQTWRPGKHS